MAGLLLMVAWYVTQGWRWQPMWASFFVISFIIYSASLPMIYGMLWVSAKYPIVTFSCPYDSHTLPTFARGPSPTIKVSRRPIVCDTSRRSEWLRSAASFEMTLDDTKRSLIKIETARLSLVVTEHPREETQAPEIMLAATRWPELELVVLRVRPRSRRFWESCGCRYIRDSLNEAHQPCWVFRKALA